MDIPAPIDLLPVINTILGVILPFVVHGIRLKLLPWSGKAAGVLTYVIAAIVTTVAYLQVDSSPTILEAAPNFGTIFSTATLVHLFLKEKLNPDA